MRLKPILGLALVLLVQIAEAQPGGGRTIPCLETRIAQAPVVFRATITHVSETVVHTNHLDWQNHVFAADDYYYSVSLKIDEVLKGKFAQKSVDFPLDRVAHWPELTNWADARVSILWFWNGPEENMYEDFYGNPSIHLIWLGPARADVLKQQPNLFPPVYDMDTTLLTRPEDILDRARTFVKKHASVTGLHSIRLPQESSDDHYFFNGYLSVPVEPSLEKTAQHLIAAPQDFISSSDTTNKYTQKPNPVLQWRCDLRTEGVEALQYFKSAKNIRLLKSLLDSPDHWSIKDWSEQYRGINVTNKMYSVRSAAFEVLKGWGVDVPKPVTQETIILK